MFKIKKRDGRFQDFDRYKVIHGIIKAGATEGEAQKAAGLVESWLPSAAINGVVDSQDIRYKVMEILRTINPKVGKSFEYYRKPI